MNAPTANPDHTVGAGQAAAVDANGTAQQLDAAAAPELSSFSRLQHGVSVLLSLPLLLAEGGPREMGRVLSCASAMSREALPPLPFERETAVTEYAVAQLKRSGWTLLPFDVLPPPRVGEKPVTEYQLTEIPGAGGGLVAAATLPGAALRRESEEIGLCCCEGPSLRLGYRFAGVQQESARQVWDEAYRQADDLYGRGREQLRQILVEQAPELLRVLPADDWSGVQPEDLSTYCAEHEQEARGLLSYFIEQFAASEGGTSQD